MHATAWGSRGLRAHNDEAKASLGRWEKHADLVPPPLPSADPGTPAIQLSEDDRFVEPKHEHFNEVERSVGFNILAKFVDLVSGSASIKASRRDVQRYGTVDHEIRKLKPIPEAALEAILKLRMDFSVQFVKQNAGDGPAEPNLE
ncbi:hypothetical protein BGZ61DRAFT_483941 [Ilyonectria robusta]|uniref:uncharacterized protein n=1 Tax=Ilyonectria robusta TaxID=1079257 RepID=UPI001E8D1092|nr:uncharacterized protein BGZ61DRAFT_483941 [Ilyonectria robusta]KAH8667256.1 hypothetical protein BGZ61DRAFT_483941 [Ilyonectria robusta]